MNIPSLLRSLCCISFFATLFALDNSQAQPPSSPSLKWTQAPSHPNPVGLASPFAGFIQGKLIVAGGANFPNQKPWTGGTKVWHDAITMLDLNNQSTTQADSNSPTDWSVIASLPKPLAYGISASFADGLICIGGSDAHRHYAEAFFLTELNSSWVCLPLPPLPSPLANACGTIVGDALFVFGGLEHPDAPKCLNGGWKLKLQQSMFDKLKLAANTAQPIPNDWQWEPLPSLPGAGRMLSTAASFEDRFWVLGGVELVAGEDGKPSRRYLNECWSLRIEDSAQGTTQASWERELDLPVPLAASPSPALTSRNGLWVLGGDDGSQVGQKPSVHRGFSQRAYHLPPANTHTSQNDRNWQVHERAVIAPRVTVPTVMVGNEYWILSGEQRPGIRSPEVWRVTVEAK